MATAGWYSSPAASASRVRPAGLRVTRLGVLAHERADDEDLLATVERLAGRLEGVSLLLAGEHPRRAPRAVVGAVLDVGQGEIAVERERQGTRMGVAVRYSASAPRPFPEASPVVDAEALLLVDDRQGEVARHDVVGEQRMGADEHVHLPGSEAFHDSGRSAAAVEPVSRATRTPAPSKRSPRPSMCWRASTSVGARSMACPSESAAAARAWPATTVLPGAHVSQKHMVGHRRRGQGGKNLVARPLLLAGELEGKRGGRKR